MKSTVLVGTLAATTLVSSLHAADKVFVLGASWRERTLNAPEGVIERNSGGSFAPRAYVVLENAGVPKYNGAFIKYTNDHGDKTYTVTTGFTGYTADVVNDATESSQRIFGHIFTPVTLANVPNAMMPFSGSTYGGAKPRRITFDKTVFQTGASTAAAAPVPNQYPPQQAFMARSILAGSATNFPVEATTLAGAITELTGRLDDSGYTRNAVAPVIVTDPPASVPRAGFVTALLSVTLGPDVFPAPTYKWFKKAVAPATVDTQVGTSATFVVPAGDPGTGTYYVVVSTSAGSDTSTNAVVPAPTNVPLTITTQMAATTTPASKSASVTIGPVTNPDAWPQPTFRWQRAPLPPSTAFVNVADADGGTASTFVVIGDPLNTVRGGGAQYRLQITQGANPVINSNPTTVTAVSTAP